MIKKHWAMAVCFVALAWHWASLAAQVPIPRDTVADRVRPELVAHGVRLGAFTLHPSIAVDLYSDDNIFFDADNKVSDTITEFGSAIDLRSDWSRHALGAGVATRIGRYADNSAENYTDVTGYVAGRITITRDSGLQLTARLGSLHEDRSSPDDRGGFAPTELDRAEVNVRYRQRSGRVTLVFDATLTTIDYHDVAGVNGDINHDDRDRRAGRTTVRLGYDVSDSTTVYLKGGYASVDYDSTLDDRGLARSSHGGDVAVGARFDLTALTSFDGHIGLARRNFDDARLQDMDSLWFGGTLIHRLSGLTTLSAYASRQFNETTFDAASGYVATRVGAGIDHELLRNLVLRLHVHGQKNDYVGIDRREDVLSALVGAHYMVNRHLDVVLDIRLRDRDVAQSISAREDYRSNTVSVQIVGKR